MFKDTLKIRILRWVFYLVFFFFNALIFGFTSYLFGKYPNLLSGYQFIHYLSGLGIVLFLIGFGFEFIRYRKFKRIITKLENENIEVKAKLSGSANRPEKGEVLTGASEGSAA